ncbi:MAG: O-antigen ligase family protein [Pirellulaceae bacterium]|nr:O-antigen ligase family protein [Pirellulaceae bacterium]
MKKTARRDRGRERHAASSRIWRSAARVEPWLCGAVAALIVATPLIPSESAARLGTHAVLVMAWFVVAAMSLVCGRRAGRDAGRWEPLDGAVALFLVLVAASAAVMLGQGHARWTLNALWLWMTAGLLYACVRRLFVGPQVLRALTSVLLALAVGLSVFGFYQVGYSNPRVRAAYAANPEQLLRNEGIDPTPGSPERQQFENRVASVEPLATFALTNSLAGLLVPSLVLWLFVVVSMRPRERAGRLQRVGCWLCAAAVLTCLILTKSRAAFVAVPVGVVLLVARGPLARAWSRGRTLWALLVALGVLVALAVRFGGVDRQVITEAPKSVLYRWQYWQATAALIRDHPWFGCGPGNFQTWYTRYKAAGASETVADPHNFLLEIAATAGLPAAICFVAAAVILVAARRRRPLTPPPAAATERDGRDSRMAVPGEHPTVVGIYAGCLAGFGLAFPAAWAGGLDVDPAVLFWACPAAIGALWLSHGWVRDGNLPPHVVLAALAALLVNLLAAGGISYPGVGQQVWWLAALALNARMICGSEAMPLLAPRHPVALGRDGIALVAVVLLAGACYVTMYRPVLQARRLLLVAQTAARADEAERRWIEACDADPWSGEAWELRAELAARSWMARPTDDGEAKFYECLDQLRRRDRNSSRVYRLCGDWAFEMYAAAPRPRLGQEAIEAYEQAVALYPNSGVLHAQLAWACHVLGRTEQAWHHAREALRLDALMPHTELRLNRQRLIGSRLAAGSTRPDAGTAELNAEQLLSQIRKVMDP